VPAAADRKPTGYVKVKSTQGGTLMTLTAQRAAEIAREHGLSLQDAAGLLGLATSEEEAEKIAADFASSEGAFRATVRNLFAKKDDHMGIFGPHGRLTGKVY